MFSLFLAMTCILPLVAQDPPGAAGAATAPGGAAAPAAQQPAAAPEESNERVVTVGADMLASSAFVWRGFVANDSFVMQPDVWVRIAGVTVSSWVNLARRSEANKPLTEHDLTLEYAFTRGPFTMSAGWINYAFLDQDSGRISNEFYAGVARDGLLSPSLRVYQDVQQGSGTYATIAVQQPIALPGKIEVVPNASLGYNRRLYTPYSGFSDAVAGMKLTLPTPLKGLTIQPFAAYSFGLDHRIATDRFYWGVGASLASQ